MNATELLEGLVTRFTPDLECDTECISFIKQETDPAVLEKIYATLPGKYPKLFEQLVLSYRWQRSGIGPVKLLDNPVDSDLDGLHKELIRDEELYKVCVKNGFIQFGFAASGSYDPACFDTRASKGRNHRIVILDHEEILCKGRIKIQSVLANSFEELALKCIGRRDYNKAD